MDGWKSVNTAASLHVRSPEGTDIDQYGWLADGHLWDALHYNTGGGFAYASPASNNSALHQDAIQCWADTYVL
jgi:hypothetical protein